jgi:hypothetical protein
VRFPLLHAANARSRAWVASSPMQPPGQAATGPRAREWTHGHRGLGMCDLNRSGIFSIGIEGRRRTADHSIR